MDCFGLRLLILGWGCFGLGSGGVEGAGPTRLEEPNHGLGGREAKGGQYTECKAVLSTDDDVGVGLEGRRRVRSAFTAAEQLDSRPATAGACMPMASSCSC